MTCFFYSMGDGGYAVLVTLASIMVFWLAGGFRMQSTRCPRCEEVNRQAAIFCAQCGERLPKR